MMGSSTLRAFIITIISVISDRFRDKVFWLMTDEPGVHLDAEAIGRRYNALRKKTVTTA